VEPVDGCSLEDRFLSNDEILKERFLSNDEVLCSQVTHIRKNVNLYKKKHLESSDIEKETKKSSKRPSSKMS